MLGKGLISGKKTTPIFLKLKKYGGDSDRMSKDLKTLKDLNQEAKERCIESESDKSHMQEESLNRPWSPDVIAYEVK